MPKVVHLGHIVFYVADLDRSLRFYRDLLGLQEVKGGDLPFQAAALTSGRTHHEVLLIEVGDVPPPSSGPRLGFYHAGFCIGTSVTELREARDAVLEAGFVLKGSSDHTITKSLYVLDPDGNEIELYIDVPGVDWKGAPELILSPIKPLNLD
jgi:catechol 2,3-dioxygenase